MRAFSDFEKKILRELVREKPYTYITEDGKRYSSFEVTQILLYHLDVVEVAEKEDGDVSITFVDASDRASLFQLFGFLLLIRFLESNFLIGLSNFSKNTTELLSIKNPKYSREEVGGGQVWGVSTSKDGFCTIQYRTHLFTSSLSGDLKKFARSEYFPTEALREFVANDFKTQAQIELEKQVSEATKQTKYARISIFIAAITTLIAVCSLLISVCRSN